MPILSRLLDHTAIGGFFTPSFPFGSICAEDAAQSCLQSIAQDPIVKGVCRRNDGPRFQIGRDSAIISGSSRFDRDPSTPFNHKIVRLLMTEMMPAGSFSPEQITALFIDAARVGDTDMLKQFLDAGMAVDAQDSRGYTALIVAAYNGELPATALLLERGADPNMQDTKGATALSGVAFKGHLAVAKLLVSSGAKLDIPSHLGRTPLMFAVMFGRQDMVSFLLAQGADPSRRDAEGLSVIDIAESHGQSHLFTSNATKLS